MIFLQTKNVYPHSMNRRLEIAKLGVGTAVIVQGRLTASPGSGQAFELKAMEIAVEGSCPSDQR